MMFTLDPDRVYSVTDWSASPVTGRPVPHARIGDGNAWRNTQAFGAQRYGLVMRALASRLDY